MLLTNRQCETAKSKDKSYKLNDGKGLYLHVMPTGSKYWRFRYRFVGKETTLAFGVFPEVSLLEARDRRDAARKQLRDGLDPQQVKRHQKAAHVERGQNTFEAVARAWFKDNEPSWSKGHAANIMHRLEKEVLPLIGDMPIDEIKPLFLHQQIQTIQDRGANEMARRVRQYASQIFRYGIFHLKAEHNPAAALPKMRPYKRGHFRALSYKDLPGFLRALEYNDARLMRQTRLAIKLTLLTIVRTNELVLARWREFDLDNAVWIIPAERMKMRREHIVPLSRQAVEILRELRTLNPFNGKEGAEYDWVTPHFSQPRLPMSNAAMLGGVSRMGFKDKTTVHGFRATAMTAIKERLGYMHEIIDRQLSHAPADKLGRAYDRAEYLDQRTKMMQDWADYLDMLLASAADTSAVTKKAA